jgi:hypothetical protein
MRRMTVLPTHGARIVEFVSKAADRDLLYHHPARRPAARLRREPGRLVDGQDRRGSTRRSSGDTRRRAKPVPGRGVVAGLVGGPDRGRWSDVVAVAGLRGIVRRSGSSVGWSSAPESFVRSDTA